MHIVTNVTWIRKQHETVIIVSSTSEAHYPTV